MGGKVLELESDKLIEQGLELGRLENQMATAVKMLQVGKYTIEEIADISGLTVKKNMCVEGRKESVSQRNMEKNHEFCNSPLLTSPTNKSNMNYNAMAR